MCGCQDRREALVAAATAIAAGRTDVARAELTRAFDSLVTDAAQVAATARAGTSRMMAQAAARLSLRR